MQYITLNYDGVDLVFEFYTRYFTVGGGVHAPIIDVTPVRPVNGPAQEAIGEGFVIVREPHEVGRPPYFDLTNPNDQREVQIKTELVHQIFQI